MNDDIDDIDEYEAPFNETLRDALAPKIKQFLIDYYGERFYNLQAETYLEIEKTIKEDFVYAVEIPDILWRNRTITDDDKFEEALENFVLPTTSTVWHEHPNWFDQDFGSDDDDDDFLGDIPPDELTDEQKKAKEIVRIANEMIDHTQNFAHFMKSGYAIAMKEAQLFLENNASFDLSILTSEGFIELHEQLSILIETLLEDLEAVVRADLNSDKKK